MAGVRRHLEERVAQYAARGIEFEPFLLETDERAFDVSRFWGVSCEQPADTGARD